KPLLKPPKIIMRLPVQTAVWAYRGLGRSSRDPLSQVSSGQGELMEVSEDRDRGIGSGSSDATVGSIAASSNRPSADLHQSSQVILGALKLATRISPSPLSSTTDITNASGSPPTGPIPPARAGRRAACRANSAGSSATRCGRRDPP